MKSVSPPCPVSSFYASSPDLGRGLVCFAFPKKDETLDAVEERFEKITGLTIARSSSGQPDTHQRSRCECRPFCGADGCLVRAAALTNTIHVFQRRRLNRHRFGHRPSEATHKRRSGKRPTGILPDCRQSGSYFLRVVGENKLVLDETP
jgi:hypothetical protein